MLEYLSYMFLVVAQLSLNLLVVNPSLHVQRECEF